MRGASARTMPRIKVSRRYRFSASHRLHTPLLSEAENCEVFGKCNNPYGHGHDYAMDVTISGELDRVRGRLLPIARLDALVRQVVVSQFDRKDLNTEAAEFASVVPTTENLAAVIARRIADAWQTSFAGEAVAFEKVRIWETKRNIFEVLSPAREISPLSREAMAGVGVRD